MLQKILRFKWEALFLLVVCILSWYYSYHEILFFHPSSMDIWRQSDCTSIAFNYYQNDMNFFLPKLHHCLNQEGYAAGECPLIYYFVAILYKIFGVNEYLFRLTNLVIFVFGLLALYKITLIILGDRFYAFFIPLLLFSCPLIAFYANNFLTDVPSLSFTFMAWLQILKYKKDQKRSNFIWSMIFFALAILLKANSAISFIALAAIAFIELNNWNEFNIDKKIFNRILLTIIGFTSVLIVVYAWYKWTIVFNEEHRTDYFAKQAWPWWPIWALSDEDLVKTVVSIFYNFNDLFNIFTTAIFFFSLVFILLNRRYLSHFLLAIFVLLLTGSIMFFSYFFVGFKNQVYYYINLMILPVFSFICTLYILKERYGKVYASIVFKLMVVGFLLLNIYGTEKQVNTVYYFDGWKNTRLSDTFYEDEFQELIKKRISPTEKVISVPDLTPNGSLYAMNLTGWSNYGFDNAVIDSGHVAQFISMGAKYLIVSDDKLLEDPALKPFMKREEAVYKNIHIYNLK